MFELFNWFGSIFGSILGYLLWFLYSIVRNYGVSILLFTIIMKLLMFPFSIKQQRSMASQAKLQKKVKELQAIYGNDKMKLSEETQKLYAKEGASPTGGCLPMLIPFPILFGIYYSVLYPLQNAVHCSAEHVKQAISLLSQIPGLNISASNQYAEMDIIKHFESLKPYLTNIFTPDEMNNIEPWVQLSGTEPAGYPQLGRLCLHAVADSRAVLGFLAGNTVCHHEASARHAAAGRLHESSYVCHAALYRLFGVYHACGRRFLLDGSDAYQLYPDACAAKYCPEGSGGG